MAASSTSGATGTDCAAPSWRVRTYAQSVQRGALFQAFDPIVAAARTYKVAFYTTLVIIAVVLACALFAAYSIGALLHTIDDGGAYRTATAVVMAISCVVIFVAYTYRNYDFSQYDFATMAGLMSLNSALAESACAAFDTVPEGQLVAFLAHLDAGASLQEAKAALFPRLTLRRVNFVVLATGLLAVALGIAAFIEFPTNPMTALFLGYFGAVLYALSTEAHMSIIRAAYKALLRDIEYLRTYVTSPALSKYYTNPVVAVQLINTRYGASFMSFTETSQVLVGAQEQGMALSASSV